MINGSESVKGTSYWDLVFDPDNDVTCIRVNSLKIKIKNYFIRENPNCTVFLYNDKVFIKTTITDGRVDEYENLPARPLERENHVVIAWLYTCE